MPLKKIRTRVLQERERMEKNSNQSKYKSKYRVVKKVDVYASANAMFKDTRT